MALKTRQAICNTKAAIGGIASSCLAPPIRQCYCIAVRASGINLLGGDFEVILTSFNDNICLGSDVCSLDYCQRLFTFNDVDRGLFL